jgi:hypothetical protein
VAHRERWTGGQDAALLIRTLRWGLAQAGRAVAVLTVWFAPIGGSKGVVLVPVLVEGDRRPVSRGSERRSAGSMGWRWPTGG